MAKSLRKPLVPNESVTSVMVYSIMLYRYSIVVKSPTTEAALSRDLPRLGLRPVKQAATAITC